MPRTTRRTTARTTRAQAQQRRVHRLRAQNSKRLHTLQTPHPRQQRPIATLTHREAHVKRLQFKQVSGPDALEYANALARAMRAACESLRRDDCGPEALVDLCGALLSTLSDHSIEPREAVDLIQERLTVVAGRRPS
jgi:hypothetical protein